MRIGSLAVKLCGTCSFTIKLEMGARVFVTPTFSVAKLATPAPQKIKWPILVWFATLDHADLFISRMLYVIVWMFLICNIPRLVLNIEEFIIVLPWYYSKYYRQESINDESTCFQMPAWTYLLSHISSFLMTLNAFLAFLIYCTASKAFQDELKKLLKKIWIFRGSNQCEEMWH